MKITSISAQANNPNRVNVKVDGQYRFSLDVFQITSLGIKVGREYDEAGLAALEQESQFGKLYARTLEYSLVRPRSVREIRDYLRRKTSSRKVLSSRTGEIKEIPALDWSIAERVVQRLQDKGYLDDEKFAKFWIENRFMRKGISQKKLKLELMKKGVDSSTIEQALKVYGRDEKAELNKVIAKKSSRYKEKDKLIRYLISQGFRYDDILESLRESDQ